MSKAPAEVIALADARAAAKAAKDFSQADRIRAEIAALGWKVVDTPSGFELTEQTRRVVTINDKVDLGITADVTVGLIIKEWIEDGIESIKAVRQYSPTAQVVALVVGDGDIAAFAREYGVIDLYMEQDPGWGSAARWLIENAPSPFQVLMDPSTILEGDALAQLKSAMIEGVAAAGWKGALVDIDDQWRSVVDRGAGEVDVLLGYLMMVRREALLATDTPHAKAKYYRNADLELSLALREQGGRLIALDLPVRQGRHHGYHDTEPELRERESKRNYDRILARFRGREEILAPRR